VLLLDRLDLERRSLRIDVEQLGCPGQEPLDLDVQQLPHETLRGAQRGGSFSLHRPLDRRAQLVTRQRQQRPLCAQFAPQPRKHRMNQFTALRGGDAQFRVLERARTEPEFRLRAERAR